MVVILGGGPAGSTGALVLARLGHTVRLITRRAVEARLAVSIPPSTQKLFDLIGLRAMIDAAGCVRSSGNTVWWGTDAPRVEVFAGGATGWQVPTHQLEELLLDQAAAAGVAIERRVVAESDLTPRANEFLIDATGRSGVLARAKSLRQYDEGPRTVALIAEWRRADDWPVPDASHTLVESYESGWAWSVPTGVDVRHVAVMVDPKRSGLVRGGSALEIYLAEIERTRAFRSLLAGARIDAGPWGWDASTYRAREYAGPGWLLAGDAGWFADPLSSAGVKKALASGWLAAIVVNTWINRPEMRPHALQFFDDRERAIERHFSAASRQFLAEAAPNHPHAFWNDRRDAADGHAPAATDESATRAAFDRLRQAPGLRVRRSQSFSIEPKPAICGNEIALEPHIVAAGQSDGFRYVHDVSVVDLIELAPSCAEVPDLVEAYQQKVGPAPFPSVMRALATAIARGWLVAE